MIVKLAWLDWLTDCIFPERPWSIIIIRFFLLMYVLVSERAEIPKQTNIIENWIFVFFLNISCPSRTTTTTTINHHYYYITISLKWCTSPLLYSIITFTFYFWRRRRKKNKFSFDFNDFPKLLLHFYSSTVISDPSGHFPVIRT